MDNVRKRSPTEDGLQKPKKMDNRRFQHELPTCPFDPQHQSQPVGLTSHRMPAPSSASARNAIFCLLLQLFTTSHVGGISVPTGKETPITPAKVTPRPTYHPPSANPAPVHEYTYDNPEPAPIDPSWVQTPTKYLNVLRPNAIFYVPIRIPNPAAHQSPYYYSVATKEQATGTSEQTETMVYQKQNDAVIYQSQEPPITGVYQTQQPNTDVYQTHQAKTSEYQTQQPTAEVYLAQQPASAVYKTKQPTAPVYQTQQPTATVYQQQHTTATAYQPQQPTPAQQQNVKPSSSVETTVYPKEADSSVYQKDTDKPKEFGAKIAPKQKWKKPQYYLPKGQGKQPTKTGYPKKAVAQPSENYYYYYPISTNAQ